MEVAIEVLELVSKISMERNKEVVDKIDTAKTIIKLNLERGLMHDIKQRST